MVKWIMRLFGSQMPEEKKVSLPAEEAPSEMGSSSNRIMPVRSEKLEAAPADAPTINSKTAVLDAVNEWDVSDAEFDKLAEAAVESSNFHLTKATDPMDDSLILTLTLSASAHDGPATDPMPSFIIRARKKSTSTTLETFIYMKEKFFYRRGKDHVVRLRYDSQDPFACEVAPSDNLSSLFFQDNKVLLETLRSGLMRVHVVPERGNAVLTIFDLLDAREALDLFSKAIFGPDFKEIVKLHPEVVDHVLRLGPKNIVLKKKALIELGFFRGPADRTKPVALYEAICRYAQSRHSSEFFGTITETDASFKANMPWMATLYNEASAPIRKEMGPLIISE